MHEKFGDIPGIGTLYYKQIYYFYDQPQIFLCINNAYQEYFIILLDDDGNTRQWLCAAISKACLNLLLNNKIEIRNIFTKPELGFVWKLINESDVFNTSILCPTDLEEDMLPDAGEYLEYEDLDSSLLKPKDTEAYIASEEERRDILDISLELKNGHVHEISCELLSDTLKNTQQLFYALGNKNEGGAGRVSSAIKKGCLLQVSGTFAASFGIRLKSDEICTLFGETSLTPIFAQFGKLLEATQNEDRFREYLSSQRANVILKFRNLMKSLASCETGMVISGASPNKYQFKTKWTTDDIVKNLRLINSEVENLVETITLDGKMVGINIDKQTFMFISINDEVYKGRLSDEAAKKTYSIPKDGKAYIERKIGHNQITNEERYVYKLISFEESEISEAESNLQDQSIKVSQ